MKNFKNSLITLFITLSIIFVAYPRIIFAENSKISLSTLSGNFPITFIVVIISAMILAIIAYIVQLIVKKNK